MANGQQREGPGGDHEETDGPFFSFTFSAAEHISVGRLFRNIQKRALVITVYVSLARARVFV